MRRRRRTLTTAVAALALGACSSGDDAGSEAADGEVQIPVVSVPPERLTPFCAAMIELADELEDDPPDDTGEVILAAYLEIVDEVPPEIADEFRAVIADLQGGTPATTTPTTTTPTTPTSVPPTSLEPGVATSAPLEDFDAEGRLPGDSPGERVNDYVRFVCRDSDNNPGPPATQPLVDVELDDES